MANNLPGAMVDAYRDYSTKKNPEAEKAVNVVMEAFTIPPHTAAEFIKQCQDISLPVDDESYEQFCAVYEKELSLKKEAEKQSVVAERSVEQQRINQLRPTFREVLI